MKKVDRESTGRQKAGPYAQGGWVEPQNLAEIEAFLRATMPPVTPRPEFVTELRGRLAQEQEKNPNMLHLFLGGAGLLSIIILLVKGSLALFKWFTGMQESEDDLSGNSTSPVQTPA